MENTPKEKREIKFRGRDFITGNWAYGFYYPSKGQSIIRDEQDKECIVITKTVGQFTGLLDRHSTEIYEGDIVKWDDDSKGKYWRVAVVEWGRGELLLRIVENVLYPLSTEKDYVFKFGSFIYRGDGDLEIIGNIYENQNLLN